MVASYQASTMSGLASDTIQRCSAEGAALRAGLILGFFVAPDRVTWSRLVGPASGSSSIPRATPTRSVPRGQRASRSSPGTPTRTPRSPGSRPGIFPPALSEKEDDAGKDMSTRYAADTSVSAEKSKAEIEKLLQRYGADQFVYATESGKAMVGFRMRSRMIRLPSRSLAGSCRSRTTAAIARGSTSPSRKLRRRRRWLASPAKPGAAC